MMENLLQILDQAVDVLGNGVRSASAAVDLTKKIKASLRSAKLPGGSETATLVTALIEEVQEAKLANLELKQQLIDLKEAAMEAQRMEQEFDRYELMETATGSIVLALKQSHTGKEPRHYLCPTCKEAGKKSILQGHDAWRKCNLCGADYTFRSQDFGTIRMKTDWDGF